MLDAAGAGTVRDSDQTPKVPVLLADLKSGIQLKRKRRFDPTFYDAG